MAPSRQSKPAQVTLPLRGSLKLAPLGRARRYALSAVAAALLTALACCGCNRPMLPPPVCPVPCYLHSPEAVSQIGTAGLITLEAPRQDGQIAESMTSELHEAISSWQLFRIHPVDRTAPALDGLLPEPGCCTLNLRQMAALRRATGCDAVIVGVIRDFQPYPNMRLSLSAALLDLRKGQVLWSVEHVWDSTDKATEKRIEKFFKEKMRSGYDPVNWRLGLISPRVFQKFVAYELVNTLAAGRRNPSEPEGLLSGLR